MRPKLGIGHLLTAAIALVIGVVIGGLGPRGELRALQIELAEAQDKTCDNPLGREMASIFRGRPWEQDKGFDQRLWDAPEGSTPAPTAPPTNDDDGSGGGLKIEINGDAASSLDAESLDVIRDAMAMRKAQSRAALIEDAQPSAPQLDQIDGAIATMNDDLQAIADDFVAEVQSSGDEPNRRELMAFAADTLDVLIAADDALGGALDAEQRYATDPEALDPLAHVDPAILEVLGSLDQ